MRSFPSWLVAATLGLGVVGCDDPAAPGTPPAASASAAAPVASAVSSTKAVPVVSASATASADAATAEAGGSSSKKAEPLARDDVELLEPGAEPRHELRYRFRAGTKEKMAMTISTTMAMSTAGEDLPPQKMPRLRLVVTVDTKKVDDEGTASRRTALGDVSVLDAPESAAKGSLLEKQLAAIAAIRGSDRITSRGIVSDARVDTSGIEDAMLKRIMDSASRSLDQLGAPLPRDEVGVGAKWRAKTRVSQFGLKLTQIATYELVALDTTKRTGKLKVTLRQTAPRGKLAVPGAPDEVKTELVKLDSKGSGEVAFDLSKTLPHGRMAMDTTTKARAEMQGERRTMTTVLHYEALFEAVKNQ